MILEGSDSSIFSGSSEYGDPDPHLLDPCVFAPQAVGVVWAEQASAQGPGPGGQGARPSLQPQFGARLPEDAEGGRKNQVRYPWPKQCCGSGSNISSGSGSGYRSKVLMTENWRKKYS
jgi:hypothetical protein